MLARRYLAERVGFEPTLRLPVNRISSAAHSTSLPPLRGARSIRLEVPGRLGARRLAEAPCVAKPVLSVLSKVAAMSISPSRGLTEREPCPAVGVAYIR